VLVRLERYLRGLRDSRRLASADFVVVSFGKSGRTWLRVLVSRYFQVRYNLPSDAVFLFKNLRRLNPSIPAILFTHDNYLANFTGNWNGKSDYVDESVVLLMRDPRDTAVSQYFQWKHRMKPRKKAINNYPADATTSLFAFVMGEEAGLPKIVRFMNGWAREIDTIANHLVVRYEDLRADTAGQLSRILQFMNEKPSREELADCVAFASVENMRKLESDGSSGFDGDRLRPGEPGNIESFKVRRAKVGGYRDYFSDEQLQQIDAYVERELLPHLGYTRHPAQIPGENAAPSPSRHATPAREAR
jgi:sulfotransferase family protein